MNAYAEVHSDLTRHSNPYRAYCVYCSKAFHEKILLLISLFYFSCDDDNNSNPVSAALDGKWINVQAPTDTLIFDSAVGDNYFVLARRKEVRDGFLLPKPGAGIYEFKLKSNLISVYNTISSCYCFHDYYFQKKASMLVIGNFYDPASQNHHETFKRLK